MLPVGRVCLIASSEVGWLPRKMHKRMTSLSFLLDKRLVLYLLWVAIVRLAFSTVLQAWVMVFEFVRFSCTKRRGLRNEFDETMRVR